ncbi:RibD family protein [bacterium]|nr:RibD family protein [bacterium]
MASSLDGKIGPAKAGQFVPIASPYDMQHLMSLRDEADGIIFGAGTFRAWPKVHRGLDKTKTARHFILSRSLDLNPKNLLFEAADVPVSIFSSSPMVPSKNVFPKHVKIVHTPAGKLQLPFILKQIETSGVKSLLVEGGGQIIYQFIKGQVLQELFLTLIPKVIGQVDAPALLGGKGLSKPPQIQVLNSRQVGDETYLHLGFKYQESAF